MISIYSCQLAAHLLAAVLWNTAPQEIGSARHANQSRVWWLCDPRSCSAQTLNMWTLSKLTTWASPPCSASYTCVVDMTEQVEQSPGHAMSRSCLQYMATGSCWQCPWEKLVGMSNNWEVVAAPNGTGAVSRTCRHKRHSLDGLRLIGCSTVVLATRY